MQRANRALRLGLSLSLLALVGCGLGSKNDYVEIEPPLPSSALVVNSWNKGSGFVVDQKERLFVTSAYCLLGKPECQLQFPIVVNGKALVRRDPFEKKSKPVKAQVIASDPRRDLIVVQVDALPEDAVELKLAAASPTADMPVKLLGAGPKSSLIYAYGATTVKGIEPKRFTFGDQKVDARMIECNADGKLAKDLAGGPLVDEAGAVVGVLAGAPAQEGGLLATDVAEVRPVVAQAFRDLGTRALRAREYEKAIGSFDRALSFYPEDAEAYNERGAAYSHLNKLDKAMADYSAALKLNPKFARAFRNRGSAYYHAGHYDKAVADCSAALAIDTKYVSALKTRSQAYRKLGQHKKADLDEAAIKVLTDPKWVPLQ